MSGDIEIIDLQKRRLHVLYGNKTSFAKKYSESNRHIKSSNGLLQFAEWREVLARHNHTQASYQALPSEERRRIIDEVNIENRRRHLSNENRSHVEYR